MSEEKTRVLREAATAAATPEPGKIVFQCPNGHKIVVAAKFAGKKGKCTKCGVPVAIPRADGSTAPPVIVVEPVMAPPAEIGPAEAPPAIELGIVEPAPEIGEPFTSGPAPAEPAVEGAEAPPAAAAPQLGDGWNFVGDAAPPPALEGGGWAADATALSPAAELGDHPTARLVARLWAELEHGGVVEVHLAGGGVLVPRWFDANWSRGTHALFGSQAADQSVTLTAVAWEAVQKVVVRQLAELPNDMFT